MRAISDGYQLNANDPTVRSRALTRARAAGAKFVRITLDWAATVVRRPPASFDPADPADSSYSFGTIDSAVHDAVANGLEPLLVVSSAPDFAQSSGRWPFAFPGSWAPDPQAFGRFAAALARRYNGAFSPPGERDALPRVRYFQAWNEPNLPRYLEPQWVAEARRWLPFSPQHYREMLNAFYAGVKGVRADDVVIAGGLAPVGEGADGRGRMTPLRFLHALLCLDAPPSTSPTACPDPPHFDAVAVHPLSNASPDRPAASSLDVAIADVAKVRSALNAAIRAGRVAPPGPKQLWSTELNWQSRPPSPQGVPARLQAHWIARGIHRLWVAGVRVVAWHFLNDRRIVLPNPLGGPTELRRPAGLYRGYFPGGAGGRPKPFLRGFRFPFDPIRANRRYVRIWALLPRADAKNAVLERKRGVRWHAIDRLRARTGMINLRVALRGGALLRVRQGAQRSASWRVSARQRRPASR